MLMLTVDLVLQRKILSQMQLFVLLMVLEILDQRRSGRISQGHPKKLDIGDVF